MSSNKGFALQQEQLPQEAEVRDWVSREISSGTVVRKELILWFAERAIRRDRSDMALAPDFVQGFLDRHPNLARRLLAPPPRPIPESQEPKPEKGARLGALARMKEMSRWDRLQALFGDHPPPQREPAPYLEGDIIYDCANQRYVVRHGNSVTEYTTYSYGMGANDEPNEAVALRFIQAHTTIPVPRVISCDWDRITMEYIDGQTLQQAWPVLTSDQRSSILAELRGYIAQLPALPGTYIGPVNGQGVELPTIIPRGGGPFRTVAELHHWLVRPPRRLEEQSMYWHQITAHLGTDYPVVFSHGDLAARNILVRDGRIVAILDWEFAGWYPEYWDYVLALRGMDNLDWETLDNNVPSLFTKRYDLEYTLMGFILAT